MIHTRFYFFCFFESALDIGRSNLYRIDEPLSSISTENGLYLATLSPSYMHGYTGEAGWKFGYDEIEKVSYLAQKKLVPCQSLQPLKIILAELVCIIFYLLRYLQ